MNKKLLEFAGFIEADIKKHHYWDWRERLAKWTEPGTGYHVKPPDFTTDLSLCFKWLVPKLYERDYFYELLQWNAGQHKAIISKKTAGWATIVSDAVAGNPALALCSALEKLIDGRLV